MKQDDSSVGPPPMQLSACPRHGVTPTLSPLSLQVGFLKILHKYEITFLLPLVQRLGKDVCAVPLPNINLRVISITSLPEGKVPALSPLCPHSSCCAGSRILPLLQRSHRGVSSEGGTAWAGGGCQTQMYPYSACERGRGVCLMLEPHGEHEPSAPVGQEGAPVAVQIEPSPGMGDDSSRLGSPEAPLGACGAASIAVGFPALWELDG